MTTALLIDSMAVMGSPTQCDYSRFLAETLFKVSLCGIINPLRAVSVLFFSLCHSFEMNVTLNKVICMANLLRMTNIMQLLNVPLFGETAAGTETNTQI